MHMSRAILHLPRDRAPMASRSGEEGSEQVGVDFVDHDDKEDEEGRIKQISDQVRRRTEV